MVGETAQALKADADAMLDRLIAEKWLTARGVCAFWPCARDGDSVTIHLADEERHVTLPFLRQQIKKSRDRANMCLADFIDPAAIGSAASRSASTASSRTRSVSAPTRTIIRTSC